MSRFTGNLSCNRGRPLVAACQSDRQLAFVYKQLRLLTEELPPASFGIRTQRNSVLLVQLDA